MFPRHAVIITSAGSSDRFNEGQNVYQKKEFLKVDGESVLALSLKPFFEVQNLGAVFVVYKEGTENLTLSALGNLTDREVPVFMVSGGKTRQESVFNALKELYAKNAELGIEIVSIHDGARPCVTKDTIMDCIAYAKLFGGAVPSIAVNDTLVKVSDDGFIEGDLDRNGAYMVQTPQTFRFPDIFNAHVKAIQSGMKSFTDDSQVFRFSGGSVAAVKGDPSNIKITYREDLEKICIK